VAVAKEVQRIKGEYKILEPYIYVIDTGKIVSIKSCTVFTHYPKYFKAGVRSLSN
jgi:hypothetical protein